MKERMDEILVYIKQHVFDETLKVEEIADIFGYDKYYFSRQFKKNTGYSVSDYLASLKSEKAIELLEQDHSIMAIQHEVGYESSGTFTNMFKRFTGSSPIQYKKEMTSLQNDLVWFEGSELKEVHFHPIKGQSTCQVDIEITENIQVGTIFIGLFKTPIPNHKPIAAIATKNLCGNQLQNIPPGSYYLLACAPQKKGGIMAYFNLKNCLRGRVDEQITFPNEGESYKIKLRHALPEDPPILLNVTKLLVSSFKDDNV